MIRSILSFVILFGFHAARAEKGISFDEAYQQIVQRNLGIARQKLQVEISKSRNSEKAWAFAPSLTAVATQDQVDKPEMKSSSTALVSKINIYRFGADMSALRASKADVESENANYRQAAQVAEEAAIRTLVSAIVAAQEREIVQKLLDSKEASLVVAKQRYSQGLTPMQEIDKLTIERENTKARLSDAESAEAAASADLETALGKKKVDLEWPWRERVINKRNLLARELKIEARADYQSLSSQISASENQTDQARRELYPSLDLSVRYGRDGIGVSEITTLSSGITLTVPLFERFKSYANYKVTAYSREIIDLKLEQLKRRIGPELDSLKKKYSASIDSAISREKTRDIAQRLYRDNFSRFRSGKASVNDLSVDQNRLLESELLATQGWSSAYLAYVTLCHSFGQSISANGECL